MTERMADGKDEGISAEEARRARGAQTIAVVAGLLALVALVVLVCTDDVRVMRLFEPALALALSVLLTFGARALDGPIAFGTRRREGEGPSNAAAAVMLWLACFAAIQIAIVVVDVVGRWRPERAAVCDGVSGRPLRGVLATADAKGRREIVLTGCARTVGVRQLSPGAAANPQHRPVVDPDEATDPL